MCWGGLEADKSTLAIKDFPEGVWGCGGVGGVGGGVGGGEGG